MDINKQVRTAGVFISVNGLFAFMVGPDKKGDLRIVRLGGHKENNETALECAARELMEEASMEITAIDSPVTYYTRTWEEEPQKIEESFENKITPILIKGEKDGHLTVIYLARSHDEPKPDSETHGILLLTKEEIKRICNEPITLNQYLENGGKALFQKEINKDLVLNPGPHILFLSKLIDIHPDLTIFTEDKY